MKKILLTLTGFLFTLLSIAQSPNLMNYQGVARNAVGNVLPNKNIALRLSILSGGPAGTVVYSETRTMLTNAFGLFNVVVGSAGATNVTGTVAGINWTAFGAGSGTKYLQVEIDPSGGSSFVNVGSTQLVSVPYALNAGSAAPVGPAGGDLTGTYPNPTVAKLQGRAVSATAPVNQNLLMWDATAISWIPATAAQAGVVSGTGTLNTVAKWTPNGTTIGNSQIFDNGTNVGINTVTPIEKFQVNPAGQGGISVSTNPAAGGFTGMYMGISQQSGGYGVLQGIKASGTTWGDVVINQNGGNVGVGIAAPAARLHTVTDLGNAGLFQTTNATNTADALLASTNTTSTTPAAMHGTAGLSGITVVAKKGAWGETDGGVGVYGSSNTLNGVMGTSNTGPAGVAGFTFGTGVGVVGSSLGGRAADFSLPAGNANTVETVSTAGTGIASNISNTNAANTSNVILATNANVNNGATSPVNGGGSVIFARKGAGLGTFLNNPSAIYASANDGAPLASIAVSGLTNAGFGIAGISLSTGTAVLGQSIGTGTAVWALNTSTGYGLVTTGKVQIQGQGAGVNRVLTSNNVGDATWNPLSAVGGVSGTGTLNFMTKWTPDGTTIGNSQLFDNGTNIGLGTVSPNGRLDIANAGATSRGAQIVNSVVTNNSSAVFAQTNNITSGSFFEGSAVSGVMPLNVASTIASGATAVKGIASTNAAISQFSGIGVQGVSAAGYGVIGNSNSGIGLAGIGWGTGYGLYTFGKLQFEGQGAATNRIMTSTDANGNAAWNTLTSIGGVSGTGTLNYVPKWTPDGTTLGNSLAFDNGLFHAIGSTTVNPGDLFHVSNPTGQTWASINQVGVNTGGFGFSRANALKYDFYLNPANDYNIFNYTSGSNALTILAANANVGINQTNPTAKLDVAGTFKLADGTQGNGKVLTSDAAGNASWQTQIQTPSVGIKLSGISTNVSVPNFTYVPITQWSTVEYENGGSNYTPGTGTYTIPVSGTYQIDAKVAWNQFTNNGYSGFGLFVNGFSVDNSIEVGTTSSPFEGLKMGTTRKLNAGDQVQLNVFTSTGATQTIAGPAGNTINSFSITLIR